MSRIYLTNINLSQNELQNARIQNLATNPASPVTGQIYYNTGDSTLRYWNGSAWLTLAQGGSVADAVSNAISALTTSNVAEGTNQYFTDERAQDAVANAIAAGTHSNITITYDDSTNKFTFAAENGVADSTTDNLSEGSTNQYFTNTRARGAVNTGDSTMEYNSSTGNFTVNTTVVATRSHVTNAINALSTTDIEEGTNQYFTDERAQDAVGNAVGTGLTYNDTTGGISVTANTYDAYGSASTVAGNLTTHTSATEAHGATGAVVGTTNTQTLTNKTLTSPKINEDVALTATATELNYVDGVTSAIQNQLDGKLALAGGTMTGAIAMGTNKITGLGTPTADTDAATKAYVDAVAEGLHVHESVRVATDANVNLANALENGDTLSGVTLATGNRVLVKNQTAPSQNGIYVVQASGAAVRALDFDNAVEIDSGDFVFVTEGTYASTGWVQTNRPATIGTDAIAFSQFSGAGTFTAGNGLTINGSEFNVVGTADRITVNADSIDISATYAGQNTITTVGTITTGTWTGTAIALANGGTGATTAAGARTNLGATTKYTEANLLLQPASGSVTWVVNHNLGTRNSNVQVFELSSYAQVEVDVVRTNTNAVTLSWVASANVAADSYQVVVVA